jgi:hypothetical protein
MRNDIQEIEKWKSGHELFFGTGPDNDHQSNNIQEHT